MTRLRGLALAALLLAPFAVRAGASSDRQLIGQLDREIIALGQKVKILEERLTGCATGTSAAPIYAELIQVFSGGPVAVTRQGAATRVSLPGTILFSEDTVNLREESAFALDLLATALKLHPEVDVLLVGHTDPTPPPKQLLRIYPTNSELSHARALAVARALSDKHGVPFARFTVAGRADLEPTTSNDTPEGRAENRRVVAHLTPGVAR
jgi:flagellar motor protein MotB